MSQTYTTSELATTSISKLVDDLLTREDIPVGEYRRLEKFKAASGVITTWDELLFIRRLVGQYLIGENARNKTQPGIPGLHT